MSDPPSDAELLADTWQLYDAEFADHVGAVVTPYDFVETEDQVEWAARVFMFGYALGSIAGAHAVVPGAVDGEADEERVDAIVEAVVEIADSEEFAVSGPRVREDFLR